MNYQVLLTEMLQGTLMTLRIFFSTLVFALPLGLLVSLGRMSKIKIINWPVRLFYSDHAGHPLDAAASIRVLRLKASVWNPA